MSFCPYCGTEQSSDALFCPSCGNKLPHADGVVAPSAPASEKKTSSKKRGWIWAVVAVLVLALAVGAFFIMNSKPLPFSEDPDAMEQSAQSVVMLNCYGFDGELIATGSGFVAYDDSTIITNYHVVDMAKEVKISTLGAG